MVCIEKILREKADFGIIGQVIPLPCGSHSKVFAFNDGREKVLKIIGSSEGIFTDIRAARRMSNDILTYDALLNQYGIKTPKIEDIGVFTSDMTGFHQIFIITTHEGISAEDIISQSDPVGCLKICCRILSHTQPILESKIDGDESRIGFDIKPANFTHNGREIIYVDSFPPRLNGALDFPAPTSQQAREVAYFRSFTIPGILLTLQTQLSRLRPELRPMFKRLILAFADQYGVGDQFRNSISEIFIYRPKDERHLIIQSLTPKEMYDLREIACELAARDSIGRSEMERIFHLTHFKGEVSQDGWEAAKREVATIVTR